MKKQTGFSIIEILIAILVSTILLAGVLHIFVNAKIVNNMESNLGDMQANARFASDYVGRIIRLAGYRTTPSNVMTGFLDYTTVFPTSAPYLEANNNTSTNGSDSITIRFQGSGDGGGHPDGTIRDCLNNSVDANTVVTNTFSISSNNELQCQAINPNATPNNNTQVLIPGVENMQILYGEDLDGNGTADRYVPSNYVSLDMSRVVSVRVSLLLISSDPVQILTGSKTFNLIGQTYTPTNTKYLRNQVSFTVTLRNLIKNPF